MKLMPLVEEYKEKLAKLAPTWEEARPREGGDLRDLRPWPSSPRSGATGSTSTTTGVPIWPWPEDLSRADVRAPNRSPTCSSHGLTIPDPPQSIRTILTRGNRPASLNMILAIESSPRKGKMPTSTTREPRRPRQPRPSIRVRLFESDSRRALGFRRRIR